SKERPRTAAGRWRRERGAVVSRRTSLNSCGWEEKTIDCRKSSHQRTALCFYSNRKTTESESPSMDSDICTGDDQQTLWSPSSFQPPEHHGGPRETVSGGPRGSIAALLRSVTRRRGWRGRSRNPCVERAPRPATP